MSSFGVLSFFVLCSLVANSSGSADPTPEVVLPQGRLQGTFLKTRSGKAFEGFLSIPYARPPVGELRFKVAQPAKPWKGVYNASAYGSVCLQFTHLGYQVVGSEDCLFINVFRPQKYKLGDQLLDVIVHIHGGAFQFLSGDFFKPTFLMEDDNHIIYVNFNYRLGPLGFMSTGDKVLPGNLGLKDQVAALKWIRDNIRQFGGNPDSVTIEGISAGGVSVHYQYLSPLSRGLFHKGISGSGAVLNPWALVDSVPQKTRKLASSLGCPTANSADLVACLQTRPAEMIVKQVPQFMPFLYNPYSPFGPVVEPEGVKDAFLSRHPYDIIKDGQTARVPWLAGFTTEEGLYPAAEFITDKELMQKLEDNWTELAPHLLDYNFTVKCADRQIVADKIKQHYLKGKPITQGVTEIVQLVGDRLFGAGITQAALMQGQATHKSADEAPVYLYRFGYRGAHSVSEKFSHNDDNYGVAHADENLYVLETDFMDPQTTDEDLNMQRHMINMWKSFAKTGVPEFPIGFSLPKVQEGLPKLMYLEIKSADNAKAEFTDDLAHRSFWASLPLKERLRMPTQQQKDEL
ncbi:venom carboxylesterase-6 isoform X1 [Nilaparvata lugens]|uniref:venom carboxylesterase-6 isoform X1 n=1 Tax=Nilaparvata lugens TaxID=108931 RepID=UPI00193CB035|nr:venom carboxylesterase-6 isoform X1 [Nilaparvata lugens]XP_039294746.1 venom carboxylesterase-6 isoform X2 [Nilaparvata lugens]XP_039294747.1 venom carboxylesterase-6 isoform X1 [Nilaparvata lugens]